MLAGDSSSLKYRLYSWVLSKLTVTLVVGKDRRMPKKGLYVSLFEGQQNPDEQQHGEGSAGPVFGPFEFVEVANGTQINMGTEAGHDELTITSQGLVYYDGFYYA